MGKASRRKQRFAGEAVAISATRSRAAAQPTGIDGLFTRWQLSLAVVAWVCWFLAHIPGGPGAALFVPLWWLTAAATGLLSPWHGLLLGVATIPFYGGALVFQGTGEPDGPSNEVLRNLPIVFAGIRVLVDRFILGPLNGKTIRLGPPTWVVAFAFIGAILYGVTANTGAVEATRLYAARAQLIKAVYEGATGQQYPTDQNLDAMNRGISDFVAAGALAASHALPSDATDTQFADVVRSSMEERVLPGRVVALPDQTLASMTPEALASQTTGDVLAVRDGIFVRLTDNNLWGVSDGTLAAAARTAGIANRADPGFLDSGLKWVLGGSAGMLMAFIAASHLVYRREKTFTDVVFAVLSVGLIAALLAYVTATVDVGNGGLKTSVPVLGWFTFPGIVNGRLAALGYPTPTSMGIAVALPFALFSAWRLSGRLAARLAAGGRSGIVARTVPYAIPLVLVAVALVVIALTESRGPMLALVAGLVAAIWAGFRMPRIVLVLGGAIGVLGFLLFLQSRFDTINIITIAQGLFNNNVSDLDRIMTWVAAAHIALGDPLFGGGWRAIERFGDFMTRQVAYAHNTVLHGFADGGLTLGITNGGAILYSAWMVIRNRKSMAPWLIAAVVTFYVCGFWDIPQVRTFASSMGGIAMGMAAGPLIARARGEDGSADGAGTVAEEQAAA